MSLNYCNFQPFWFIFSLSATFSQLWQLTCARKWFACFLLTAKFLSLDGNFCILLSVSGLSAFIFWNCFNASSICFNCRHIFVCASVGRGVSDNNGGMTVGIFVRVAICLNVCACDLLARLRVLHCATVSKQATATANQSIGLLSLTWSELIAVKCLHNSHFVTFKIMVFASLSCLCIYVVKVFLVALE